jgi:hypothetical protein
MTKTPDAGAGGMEEGWLVAAVLESMRAATEERVL